jgi:hypothetical protein
LVFVLVFTWAWCAEEVVQAAVMQIRGLAPATVESATGVGRQAHRTPGHRQGHEPAAESVQPRGIRVATLDFARRIDVSGAPFKGFDGAPVVIAVFSDFE